MQYRTRQELQVQALRSTLLRDATTTWRGRQAERQPARTLIYKKRDDGSVIGFAVDATMLEQAAERDAELFGLRDDVARNARPLVFPAGQSPPAELRSLAAATFGEALPASSRARSVSRDDSCSTYAIKPIRQS